MKKKDYVTPELEYWCLRTEDIIMTSGDVGQPDFYSFNLDLGGNMQ